MTGQEITLGGIGISVILSILLRMIYSTWQVQNRFKPWIAVGIGMAASVTAILITMEPCAPQMVATYLAQGFMTGATATGIYEMTKNDAPK